MTNDQFPIRRAILLATLLFVPGLASAQTDVPDEKSVQKVLVQEIVLPEPSIAITPDVFYPLDEILYIEGRGAPEAVVTVALQKQGEKPLKFSVKADSFGEWVVSEKTYMPSGNWEVRARQQSKGEVSDWSNPRVIRSVVTGVNIFGFNVRYVVITVILLLFFAIIAGILFYFLRKIKNLKQGLLEKQLRETETQFHENVSVIRRDLMSELQTIVANAEKRPLTSEELARRDHLLSELDNLEKSMEHNIQDIGRKI